MKKCFFALKTIDNITGEIIYTYGHLNGRYKDWNKDNKCPFFKKRLFAKKNKKVYCVNCKYFSGIYIFDNL